jgi:hemolysin-activating ACP:hemolysin acyltransferase
MTRIIPDLPKGGLDYLCDCHARPEKGTFNGYLQWAFIDHVRAMVDYDSDTDNLEVIKHYRLQRILKER